MLYGLLGASRVSFKPEVDIPDLSGKVIFVTGGNIGLGRETIRHLAQHSPSKIYLAARNASKAQKTISELQALIPNAAPIVHIPCDLTSFSSVQACAREFVAREQRLDILVLNAGVMVVPPALTEDGYEMQWATNQMGHALLTKLLLPTLLRTANPKTDDNVHGSNTTVGTEGRSNRDVRIIALGSIAHVASWGLHLDGKKTVTGGNTINFYRYSESKLANAVYARELARRYGDRGILSVSVHPGLVESSIWTGLLASIGPLGRLIGWLRGSLFVPLEEGVAGVLWAATAPRSGEQEASERKGTVKTVGVSNGEYYTPTGVEGQGTRLLYSDELGKRLWDWTEKELEGWEL